MINQENPPHSQSASKENFFCNYEEESLLSSLLFNRIPLPTINLPGIFNFLEPEDFELEDHRLVYKAITECYNAELEVKVYVVIRLLKNDVKNGRVKPDLITKLSSAISFGEGLEELAIEIKRKATRRRIADLFDAGRHEILDTVAPAEYLGQMMEKLNNYKSDLNNKNLPQ